MTPRRSCDALLTSAATVVSLLLTASVAGAEPRVPLPTTTTTRIDDWRCGESWGTYLTSPTTYVYGDVDGDGTVDHFYATPDGVDRYRVQEGTIPETLVRASTVYAARGIDHFVCVDLRFADVDDDGDLDMVFASPQELVVLEQRAGRFTVARREPLALDRTTRVRIAIRGSTITVE